MKVHTVDEFMELCMAFGFMGSRMIISGPLWLHDKWETIGTGGTWRVSRYISAAKGF